MQILRVAVVVLARSEQDDAIFATTARAGSWVTITVVRLRAAARMASVTRWADTA